MTSVNRRSTLGWGSRRGTEEGDGGGGTRARNVRGRPGPCHVTAACIVNRKESCCVLLLFFLMGSLGTSAPNVMSTSTTVACGEDVGKSSPVFSYAYRLRLA